MPIDVFDPLKPTAPTPAAPLAARQARTASAVAATVANGYKQVVSVHNRLMSELWANPLGLTPQEAAAAIGNRGAALLALAGYVQLIAGLIAVQTGRDPTADLTAPPAGWTLAAGGEGGTLVLTPPPPAADPE